MKLKLFIFTIFTLLALVAYKTYRDTVALKSIDSYESCVAAKGSRIQESYPATCITRLGVRFTQNIPPSPPTSTKCGICPQLMPPAPDFCKDGKIVPGTINDCGCPLGPECVK